MEKKGKDKKFDIDGNCYRVWNVKFFVRYNILVSINAIVVNLVSISAIEYWNVNIWDEVGSKIVSFKLGVCLKISKKKL